jgi:hypothetical protein
MTQLNGPNYSVLNIDLSAAGRKEWRQTSSRIVMVRAENADGTIAQDARVGVRLGINSEDYLTFTQNTKVIADTNAYFFEWAAQPGVTAFFCISREGFGGGRGIEIDAPPATVQVTSAMGAAIVTSAATITDSAALVLAVSANRKKATIKNTGSATVYIGPAGVTSSTGFPLDGGEGYEVAGTTAAIYAVTATGSGSVRVVEEA